ncbi:MAG TPA: hypothetical protein VFW11_08655, partial [Cyclobacteriaceae bacterium]|nr:hypothetical protein [Cyclobacteriaceae bacterium]
YGRSNIIRHNDRPHMFVKELQLNIEYLKEKLETEDAKVVKDAHNYASSLIQGIAYYLNMAEAIEEDENRRNIFIMNLKEQEDALKRLISVEHKMIHEERGLIVK